jgi:hypothetical protein
VAFWIAQELEKLCHVPRIHEWEIPAGGDITKWMEESLETADHCLVVVSKTYLTEPYSSWERRAAQWAANSTRRSFALPVFIEACKAHRFKWASNIGGSHGQSEEDSRVALIAFLKPAERRTPRHYSRY